MSKEELNVCLKFFLTCLRGRTMVRIVKSIRAAIDHFLRMPPHNKPFSKISDQANKLLEHLLKASGKQASLRNQFLMSRWGTERVQIGREQSKSCTATEDDPIFVWVSFLADEDERINDSQRQQFCTCEKHTKELSVLSWTAVSRFFTSQEKPSGWSRTSKILKMNLTLR